MQGKNDGGHGDFDVMEHDMCRKEGNIVHNGKRRNILAKDDSILQSSVEVGTNGLAGLALNEGSAVILQVAVVVGIALGLELSIQSIGGSVVCHLLFVVRKKVKNGGG